VRPPEQSEALAPPLLPKMHPMDFLIALNALDIPGTKRFLQ
jgi:hypothetical protein